MAFWRGNNTLKISVDLFVENRKRLIDSVRKVAPKASVIVLQGGIEKNRYNTDAEDLPFRQVFINFFKYVFAIISFIGIVFFLGIWST